MATSPTRLILVGGFLGAGKTSLLWEAAQRLTAEGNRVGLITNDQAPELVDSAFLQRGAGRSRKSAEVVFAVISQGCAPKRRRTSPWPSRSAVAQIFPRPSVKNQKYPQKS